MKLYAMNKDYLMSYLDVVENASIEDISAAHNAFGSIALDSIVTHDKDGKTATIKIVGPLSLNGPSPLARFFGFGGVSYAEIISAANELANDPTIDKVKLVFDTPGGTTQGMDQARQAIEELARVKNVLAENHGLLASAGLFLASAAAEIIAMSPLVETGSVGVVIAGLDFTDSLAREGVKRIKIISANAPNKQADPTTSQGLKVLQDEIDAVERVFIQVLAKGRNVTEAHVIENFGQGAILIAQDPDPDKPSALKAGMIDSVVTQIAKNTGTINDNSAIIEGSNTPNLTDSKNVGNNEDPKMDLIKLKAEHPGVFAEALALGVIKERERVDAHITMGEAAGDMKLAVSCIKGGVEHGATSNTLYLASQMNKNSVIDRADEKVGDLDTAKDDDSESSVDAQVNALVAAKLGVELHG